jgi:hypothetical protein
MAASFSDKVLATTQIMTLVQRLRMIQGFAIRGEAPDGRGGVNFKMSSDISFSSWGENINLHMYPYNEQQTFVEIKSECSMPTQVIDWGKNKSNVNKIMNYLLDGIMVQKV